ncbi:LytTR family DNA-binding domain-containing protein [Olivibacter sp. 47]|uniref:LytR/AlgR family response regulator transcription factor n=1 Tax=Olivibacter sp. 47 TaxID=3056486 RepID=UPI0025A49C28|nr:LytTR family DNA-binding domain-containing protein [Olivibacter sp. 47]MDM8173651.1 LytTR family DNA-binding domain-containing protein [Olivibacter sp. 47]
MKVVVIEDEIAAYNNIERLVRNSREESLLIIAWIKSVEEAQEWLANNDEPDLLLMDIQLSDGLVFELFESIQLNCPVVFTTAFDSYALKAFDYNALSYLLKPISQIQFDNMVEKVKKNTSIYRINSSLNNLISKLDRKNEKNIFRERFLLKKGEKYFIVQTSNIAYICISPSVILETFDGERFILGNTLDELMNQLDPSKFFRCNRQTVVNVEAITAVVPYFKNSLRLTLKTKTDFEIVISKDKVKEFKIWMDK